MKVRVLRLVRDQDGDVGVDVHRMGVAKFELRQDRTGRRRGEFSLSEENAVLLTSEHGNQVPRRVGCLRLEVEAGLVGRPLDCGSRAEERTLEALRAVVNFRRRDDAVPFHIERNGGADGGDRRNCRIREAQAARKTQPLRQRVGQVMVIEDLQVLHAQAGSPLVEVHLDSVVFHLNHPEHVVRVNVHVEVMNLLR